MTSTIFVLMLNPLVSAIFAVALMILWRHQPQLGFVGLLCLSYGLKALGFVLHFVQLPELFVATRLASNIAFLAAAVTLCASLVSRHGVRHSYRPMLAIAGITFASFLWFLLVQPSFAGRVVAINTGIAVICFLTTWILRPLARKNAVERLLAWLMGIYGVAALGRQAFVFGPDASTAISTESSYWIAVTASDMVISLLLVLCFFSGIALEVFDRLRDESERDALSGLLNRRGFMDRATEFVARADESGIPATLILADMDRFKAVNDTYGHDAGDRAIVAFASHLAGAAGEHALVARLGGEEFVILAPATHASAGRLLAERIRASFAAAPVPMPGDQNGIRLTASFGVAEIGRGESLGSAIRRSDAALYAAKAKGRDCTIVALPADTVGAHPRLALPAA